jgi:hypothetical protein
MLASIYCAVYMRRIKQRFRQPTSVLIPLACTTLYHSRQHRSTEKVARKHNTKHRRSRSNYPQRLALRGETSVSVRQNDYLDCGHGNLMSKAQRIFHTIKEESIINDID